MSQPQPVAGSNKGLLAGLGCLVLLIGGGAASIVLFIILSTGVLEFKDYKVPQISMPLSTSDIVFVLGAEALSVDPLNTEWATFYYYDYTVPPGKDGIYPVHTRSVPGLSLLVRERAPVYAPFAGLITMDGASNIFLEGDGRRIFVHGISLTVEPGMKVQKGDQFGIIENSVLETGLQERSGRDWAWISNYYIQYLYWTARGNVFPLYAPPDSNGKKKYRYSSEFGYRTHPVTGEKEKFHNGLDVAVPVNTPILAVEDGTIESARSASDGNAGGNRMYLISADGKRRYCYMHLNSFLGKAGQVVRKGQQIAWSGNTGRSTGPHLHLALYDVAHGNEVYDPGPIVRYWESTMDWDAAKAMMRRN
ncbi:peptidoglycan DD-metalloendopeptidase family protein [Paenibacillus pasadenensis]|uniref:peptidoglycan DD-metalloendopeptidase family protein n=1 Tax=Paenibacillus pasadenensis TaxID=217090 RepID=UPI0006937479|nr:peptidoglycan DD-metalloendopeptidase family protein [Paenibacillus pasadenensis]